MTRSINPMSASCRTWWSVLGSLSRLGCAMVLVAAMAFLAVAQAAAGDNGVPDGLSPSDWSSIRAAYEANRHAAFAVEGGYQARNPGQAWRTRFDGRGFVTTPDAGDWSWGLELASFGRGSAEHAVVAPTCVEADGKRVAYQWSEALTEWYINDSRGLEHGYTVHRRPVCHCCVSSGDSSSHCSQSSGTQQQGGRYEPLTFTLAVRGGLRPQVSSDGRNVTFISTNGAAVVNYAGLKVFDARGAILPSWFEVGNFNSPSSILHSQFVRIVVDDSDAIYPLTIDPIAQQAYLKASNTGASDVFGFSVAVSGDTVVVGALGEDSNATGVNGNQADDSATDSGAAYIFARTGATWSQQAYLKASNTGAGDQFGVKVAVSGDTVVVGAYGEDSNATGVDGNQADNSASFSGAAYVFVRNGTTWSQQAYLKASNTNAVDQFGFSLAVSGDTVVIGSISEDSNATGIDGNQADNSSGDSGAVYVFVRSGTTWSQQAYVKASNTGENDFFGESVAVSSDTLVVSAWLEDSNATGVDGNQTDNSSGDSGAVYVFVRSGTTWSQQAYVKASNTGANDIFGRSLAVSGDTLVVGSPLERSSAIGVNGNQADNSADASGAAYVFVRSGTTWSQQAYVKASNTGEGDRFGWSVAISGNTVLVGAYGEDSNSSGVNGNQADNSALNAGAAYVFVRSGITWSQQAYFKASNTGSNDRFGYSMSVSGDTVVVGAYREDSNATGVDGNQANNSAEDSGAAYVFVNCPNLGSDMNCDCVVDELDIEPFVLALLDPVAYAVAYPPPCDILHGDMQPDGNVDGGDVQGFTDMLVP